MFEKERLNQSFPSSSNNYSKMLESFKSDHLPQISKKRDFYHQGDEKNYDYPEYYGEKEERKEKDYNFSPTKNPRGSKPFIPLRGLSMTSSINNSLQILNFMYTKMDDGLQLKFKNGNELCFQLSRFFDGHVKQMDVIEELTNIADEGEPNFFLKILDGLPANSCASFMFDRLVEEKLDVRYRYGRKTKKVSVPFSMKYVGLPADTFSNLQDGLNYFLKKIVGYPLRKIEVSPRFVIVNCNMDKKYKIENYVYLEDELERVRYEVVGASLYDRNNELLTFMKVRDCYYKCLSKGVVHSFDREIFLKEISDGWRTKYFVLERDNTPINPFMKTSSPSTLKNRSFKSSPSSSPSKLSPQNQQRLRIVDYSSNIIRDNRLILLRDNNRRIYCKTMETKRCPHCKCCLKYVPQYENDEKLVKCLWCQKSFCFICLRKGFSCTRNGFQDCS